MDQSMPGMDGPIVVRHIRAMPGPAGQLPILAVTASAMPEDIEASMAGGMDGHVAKPIERTTLLAAIAVVLDRTTGRRQSNLFGDNDEDVSVREWR
jgi:CheY-like chemotaxis protein